MSLSLKLFVTVEKPGALRGSRSVGVTIKRPNDSILYQYRKNIDATKNISSAKRELSNIFT
ncbi:MAG: hypothetical protein Ct9H300mP3_03160 [Gammaproteobacteria bacterium]|nr:MAG: hypothetical protein Ct9H300mP3_03160 [Gammaproteobacteria bacterium]